jgi:hypothetical protein
MVLAAAQAASQGFCLLADWAASLAGGQQQQEWLQQLLQLKQQVRATEVLAVCCTRLASTSAVGMHVFSKQASSGLTGADVTPTFYPL